MAKSLRFAALIRVSTEKQEEQGESLRTQRSIIEDAAKSHGGRVVKVYAGQEHATAGWERQQLDTLLRDAARKPRLFDAVIVANESRWSRDNARSKNDLQVLRQNDVRFFVARIEYNLRDPKAKFWLGLSAEIDEFKASMQKQDSVLNRIARAKRGCPTAGKLPFGRLFDRDTEKWSVDEEKRKLIISIADRYLAGESMSVLADEMGINHSNLHKIMMNRCGTEWSLRFDVDDLNIHEDIPITIPRLLPESTIKKLRRRCEMNKTYTHGEAKNEYLLGRMIFCEHCGYAMFGQTTTSGPRYYRHAHGKRVNPCKCVKSWVRAEVIEENVLQLLFDRFGNQTAIEKAIAAGTPDLKKLKALEAQRDQLIERRKSLDAGLKKILKLIASDKLTEEEAGEQLKDSRRRIADADEKLHQLESQLSHAPDTKAQKDLAEKVAKRFKGIGNSKHFAIKNRPFSKWTMAEKRELLQTVFGGKRPDGKRMGVYIKWISDEKPKRNSHLDPKAKKIWTFSLLGTLIDEQGRVPFSSSFFEDAPGEPENGQAQCLETPISTAKRSLTKSASC